MANAALSELSKLLQELACFGVRACSHLHRLPGEDREVGTAPHSGPRRWDIDRSSPDPARPRGLPASEAGMS